MKETTKTMLKRSLSATLAVMMAAGMLVGCSKGASDKDKDGKTILAVGSWPQKEGADKDNIEARKVRFEEANPDVSIVPDSWTFDLKSFYAKAAGGQLPTLFGSAYTEVSQIISSGYSSDLSSALDKYGMLDKMNPQLKELVSDDGKVFAFPYSAYALGIACNMDMMNAAGLVEADGTPKQPKDWYELAEFAVKIKEATGKPGFIFPTSGNMGGWIFTPVAWSFGVDFMEQEGDKWIATFNTPEAVEALQYIKDLRWKYDVLPSTSLVNGEEYYKSLATGNAGMLITAGDVPARMPQYGMTPEQLGMMGMPEGPKRHVTLLGGIIYAVNDKATDDQIDAAIRWIQTAYTPEANDEFKTNIESNMKAQVEKKQLVGIKSMKIWSGDAPAVLFENETIDKYSNANPNHVKLYNDFVADMGNCELQAEEPVCAQELYAILDSCIQEVLVNKDADCAALIEKAANDFQSNYLDNY